MDILLRVSCNFVADGAKTGLRLRVALSGSCFAETGKGRGFARSGALGLPGAGHVVAGGVFAIISGASDYKYSKFFNAGNVSIKGCRAFSLVGVQCFFDNSGSG